MVNISCLTHFGVPCHTPSRRRRRRIAKEAFAAYQRQVAVVDQMISTEEQLQSTLKATGAAQDDPKVEESLRREVGLVQQRNKLWDDYKTKVEKVREAEEQFVRGDRAPGRALRPDPRAAARDWREVESRRRSARRGRAAMVR